MLLNTCLQCQKIPVHLFKKESLLVNEVLLDSPLKVDLPVARRLSVIGLLRTSSRQLAKLENDTRDAFWRGSSICIITTQEVVLLQKTDKTAILDTLFTMERVEESYSQEDTIDSYYDPRSEIYLAVYRRRALLLNFKKKSACFYK